MARTYRKRLHFPDWDTAVLERRTRDNKGRCWCCGGVKVSERRKDRKRTKANLRRDPENI